MPVSFSSFPPASFGVVGKGTWRIPAGLWQGKSAFTSQNELRSGLEAGVNIATTALLATPAAPIALAFKLLNSLGSYLTGAGGPLGSHGGADDLPEGTKDRLVLEGLWGVFNTYSASKAATDADYWYDFAQKAMRYQQIVSDKDPGLLPFGMDEAQALLDAGLWPPPLPPILAPLPPGAPPDADGFPLNDWHVEPVLKAYGLPWPLPEVPKKLDISTQTEKARLAYQKWVTEAHKVLYPDVAGMHEVASPAPPPAATPPVVPTPPVVTPAVSAAVAKKEEAPPMATAPAPAKPPLLSRIAAWWHLHFPPKSSPTYQQAPAAQAPAPLPPGVQGPPSPVTVPAPTPAPAAPPARPAAPPAATQGANGKIGAASGGQTGEIISAIGQGWKVLFGIGKDIAGTIKEAGEGGGGGSDEGGGDSTPPEATPDQIVD